MNSDSDLFKDQLIALDDFFDAILAGGTFTGGIQGDGWSINVYGYGDGIFNYLDVGDLSVGYYGEVSLTGVDGGYIQLNGGAYIDMDEGDINNVGHLQIVSAQLGYDADISAFGVLSIYGTDGGGINLGGGANLDMGNGAIFNVGSISPSIVIAGSYSTSATAQTAFTVTIGETMANTSYKVNITPTDSLAAAAYYISAKTTTTFTITYLTGLTGTVSFDWAVFP